MKVNFNAATDKASFRAVKYNNRAKTNINCNQVKSDNFVSFSSRNDDNLKVSKWRIVFSHLNDEQIDKINESGLLPENAIFISDGMGNYSIGIKELKVVDATRVLPEGYELKKNKLGFTTVVRKR